MSYQTQRQAAADDDASAIYYDSAGVPHEETPLERARRVYAAELRADSIPRICLHCTGAPVVYRETENVGRLRCRYHPGFVDNGRYTCCRTEPRLEGAGFAFASPYQYGCVRCDHTAFVPEAQQQVDPRPEGEARWHHGNLVAHVPAALRAHYQPLPACVLQPEGAPKSGPSTSQAQARSRRQRQASQQAEWIQVLRIESGYAFRG